MQVFAVSFGAGSLKSFAVQECWKSYFRIRLSIGMLKK